MSQRIDANGTGLRSLHNEFQALSANDTIGLYHGDGNSSGANAGSGYYQAGQCNIAGYLLG